MSSDVGSCDVQLDMALAAAQASPPYHLQVWSLTSPLPNFDHFSGKIISTATIRGSQTWMMTNPSVLKQTVILKNKNSQHPAQNPE